ncbi:hypothetical protein OS493_017180 [Desmophyllum pertusum]|uniref:Uncharacterized protein n=1 Tax=Desmophyllum pertusum TaxID=174260 RepID=A0A9W9YFT4_9CNID|nr:hypothetical protein OS493_017180 [Desmophyllum pertusum]
MYDGSKSDLFKGDVNMAAMFIRSRVVAFLLLNICNCSLTTLLEAVTRLLTDRSRFYPYADHNIAENLIVRLEVDSLDRGDQANDEGIPHLKSLVRQLQILLNRWEMFTIRAVRPIRALPGVSAANLQIGLK